MEYLGAWGTLIHEKNLKSKISCQTPFKHMNMKISTVPEIKSADRNTLQRGFYLTLFYTPRG